MLIDTHAHLYWESYDKDLSQVIQRSLDAGVTTVINVGVDIKLSKKALEQTTGVLTNIPNLKAYSTIGIHPHEAIKYSSISSTSEGRESGGLSSKLTSEVFYLVSIQKDIEQLEKLYQTAQGKIVAVGECGLDFFFDNNPKPTSFSPTQQKQLQKQLFQAQIELAKKLNLPLIVHCRDNRSQNPEESEAWDETLKMIGSQKAILHCYSGLGKTTQKALLSPNLLISFAGTITYPKNEYLRETAKILPLEKIVLETDCPFLPPQSKRGQRNEPSTIKEIAQLIADLKGLSLETVATQTTANVVKLFAF